MMNNYEHIDNKIMRCTPEYSKMVLDYIAGNLDAKKAEEAEDHLFYCDSCSKKVELFNNLKSIYKQNRAEILSNLLDPGFVKFLKANNHQNNK